MQEKFLIEKIKLLTELLRGFFALFILDITGVGTMLIRQKFLTNNFEYNLLVWAILFFTVIFVILIIIFIAINWKIKSLKQ